MLDKASESWGPSSISELRGDSCCLVIDNLEEGWKGSIRGLNASLEANIVVDPMKGEASVKFEIFGAFEHFSP